MNPDTKPERPRPKDKNVSTHKELLISTHEFSFPLTIEPKKILIKGKARKIFESLYIPLLPKKDNQKDTSTDKAN